MCRSRSDDSAPLSHFRLTGEQFERVQQVIEHPCRGCRIVWQNRIADGV